MTQSLRIHCDCCGLPLDLPSGEDCPRCGYPIALDKEMRFLQNSLGDLQRVAHFGGATITVAGLISRYQNRLNYLYQVNSQQIAVGVASWTTQTIAQAPPAPVAQPDGNSQIQPTLPLQQRTSPWTAAQAGAGAAASAQQTRVAHAFTVDQGISLSGILGAFLGLLAALSYVINSGGHFLVAVLVALGLHIVFGAASILVHRFPALRALSLVCTLIYALSVPILGYAVYNWMAGGGLTLSLPALITVAALYAAVVYAALAVYQRSALFAYLSLVSLVVVDLSIARDLQLAYWWWSSMLLLLALLLLAAQFSQRLNAPRRLRQVLAEPRAVLYEPVRPLMYSIVGVCALALVATVLYALIPGNGNVEVRFSILSAALLLTLWDGLSLWVSGRQKSAPTLPYLLLGCVLAGCYAFNIQPVGYVIALIALALLYHGLNRYAGRLLQPFGRLGLNLDQLALVLAGVVPLISDPALLLQLVARLAPTINLPQFQPVPATWQTLVELLAIGCGSLVTISIILTRAGAPTQGTPASKQGNAWPWLLLLSGAITAWGCEMTALALRIEPLWGTLVLAVALTAAAVLVRRRAGTTWSNPLDVLALVYAFLTLGLSSHQTSAFQLTLLLCFAALAYAVLLYQRRSVWLFVPAVFALLTVPLMFFGSPGRAPIALLLALLLPFAAVGMRHLMASTLHPANIQDPLVGRWPITIAWEWPLLAFALTCGVALALYDLFLPLSTAQQVLHIAIPYAVEMAALALAWYLAAALARVMWWLLAGLGFAVWALLIPTDSFWALAAIALLTALLAFAVSRLLHKTWAMPWYAVALVAALMMGIHGFAGQQPATPWTLLAFALLIYGLDIAENLDVFLWLAPLYATWSVFDSAIWGDLYRPPTVALLCAACAIAIHFLRPHLPGFLRTRAAKMGRYALPFYITAIAAAVLTGIYGTLGGINRPFYTAIPDALLLYAAVAFAVLLLEQRPEWLWLVAAFALWGITLATQTNAWYVAGAGLGAGMVALLLGRFALGTPGKLRRFTWNWPWYGTALAGALLLGTWRALPLNAPQPTSMIAISLLTFALLAVGIMFLERFPQMLLVPVALAAWAIWQWQPPLNLAALMSAYTILNVLVFSAQFAWDRLQAETYLLTAKTYHRALALAGQALVVLAIMNQGGVFASSGALVHVGAGALCVLAVLVFWTGYLQDNAALRHYCYYTAGLLLSLVVPWELSAFHQTNLSLLSLVPASYLVVVAPFIARDSAIPEHHYMAQAVALLGSALLLLPTLWLSFGNGNLNPTLTLAAEAIGLLIVGIGTRTRVFVLGGAGLVVLAGLRALFLQSLGIPTSLALAMLGLTFLVVATALALGRRRIQAAWTNWD